jgi:TrmH family RNA methyltransferase
LLRELLRTDLAVVAVLVDEDALHDTAVRDLLEEARSRMWRVEAVERRVIEEVADTRTPQALVSVAAIPRWTWDDVRPGPIVILDGVQDPGNVGTLIRTGVSLGCAGVVTLESTADPWGPKAVRASAGAGLRRPVLGADRASTVAELERRKIPLWIAAADGEPIGRGDLPERRLALALGGETRGVSRVLEDASARRVAIEMHAGMESLNVAAAGAILLDRIMGVERG